MRSNSLRSLTRLAIRKSTDLKPKQKLALRLALAFNPAVAEAVEDHLIDVATDAGVAITFDAEDPTVEPTFDLDDFEKLLQILIEYLPQLIAIFEKFFLAQETEALAILGQG